MKTINELLDSNPVFKAVLYVLIAVIPVLEKAFQQWKDTPPKNGYEITLVLLAVLYVAGVTLKAFTSNPTPKQPEKIKLP